MTHYYFVRHGESTANAAGVVAGWADVALTDKGVEQAHALGRTIKESTVQFDLVITSTLTRAFDTAKIIAGAIEYPIDRIKVLPDLRERSSGDLEGAPVAEVYENSEEDILAYGGENAEVFRSRVLQAQDEIRSLAADAQNVLIVAHAGVYRMAVAINQQFEPATKMYTLPSPPNAELLQIPM
jgi:broad specificity phosphatase PhoE